MKERVPYPTEHRAELTEEALAHLGNALCQAYRQDLPAGLQPTLLTTYRRTTFVPRTGENRLTCDVGLVCRATSTRSTTPGRTCWWGTKSTAVGGAPDRLLREFGVRPATVSKYCVAVGGPAPRAALEPLAPDPAPVLRAAAQRRVSLIL